MNGPDALRRLGVDGLAEVVSLRPDILGPVPPRSLAELGARLDHAASVRWALQSLDRSTLQVAEAMVALGGRATRDCLDALLGAEDSIRPAVDDALDVLRRHRLLDDGVRAPRSLAAQWPRPLGVALPVADVVPRFRVDELRAALAAWGAPTGGRKADLADRLCAVLADGDRVRAAVADAPVQVGDRLVTAARSGGDIDVGHGGYRSALRSPLRWALDRCLAVQVDWATVQIPAEVALALRGAGWTAPFEPHPPPLPWLPVDQRLVERDATAAAGHALRTVADVLREAGRRPIPLLKDSALGVRELRRTAKATGCTPGETRLVVALTHRAALLGVGGDGLAPTSAADAWSVAPPAARLAVLVDAWVDLGDVVLDAPEAPLRPATVDAASRLRWTCLVALSAMPGQAPSAPSAFGEWAAWKLPLAGAGDVPAPPAGASPRPAAMAEALLAEAAWLGLTGAGALSPLGTALVDGADLVSAVGDSLGQVRDTVRLQADLTAVALGEPSARLAGTMDSLADRETGAAAVTWRFSTASIRRALDAGDTPDDVLAALERVGARDVPQPLRYLVGDVARRHGRVRGGDVGCYLRSDDTALLREAVADSRLRRLGLRTIAPTVLVGSRPLGETLAAMRAAGYAPVEEAEDGSVVVVRQPVHRAGDPPAPLVEGPDGATVGPVPEGDAPAVTAADVARSLLDLPDRPRGLLFDVGGSIVDVESARDLLWDDDE